ncbi:MAG: NUDIX hydrolase [Oscillibacter sp.]|nr:NUDIX hydrolase [Oscillibacter sp.]
METHENLAWEEVNCEHIVCDEWIDFRKSTYKMPNGKISGPYYSYSRKNFVIIVATTEDDRYICVRQFRHGIKRVTTEFCAGCIEHIGDAFEDALSTAKRELLEETGYGSNDWRHLLTVPVYATLADNYMSIFMAKNCQKINSQQNLDNNEFLDVHLYSRDKLEEIIKDGEFSQASHILALFMADKVR